LPASDSNFVVPSNGDDVTDQKPENTETTDMYQVDVDPIKNKLEGESESETKE
jgi:hypothetical protein